MWTDLRNLSLRILTGLGDRLNEEEGGIIADI